MSKEQNENDNADKHEGVIQALEMNANLIKYGTIDAPKENKDE